MQLSTYIPSYAEFLEKARATSDVATTTTNNLVANSVAKTVAKETLVIGEHYVPRDQILAFMLRAAEILRAFETEVIYGTIRAITRDTVSFLP